MKCRMAADFAAAIPAYNRNPALREQDRIADCFIPAKTIERQPVAKLDDGARLAKVEMLRRETALRSNAIRNTLRNFVFLQIRPTGLAFLASEPWNDGYWRISHYRDHNGDEVTVAQKMMTRFIKACTELGSKLEICTVQDGEITQGLTVTVREGAFAGLEAEVVALQYKAEGLRFTIAVKLFSNGSVAYVHDCKPEDVIVSEKDSYVFNADFIDRIEDSLLNILKRRIKRKETPMEQVGNNRQIRSYFQLHNSSIDRKDLALRFDALMSICASMLRIGSAKAKYAKLLKRRLKEVRQQPAGDAGQTRSLAYLLSALFLSTKDPVYRDELKTVVQGQLTPDDILRRHLVILRWLK